MGVSCSYVGLLQKVRANKDGIQQLEDNVQFFKDSVLGPLEQYDSKNPVPPEIDEAIKALSTCVYVSRCLSGLE
jgi:hypothetical protein